VITVNWNFLPSNYDSNRFGFIVIGARTVKSFYCFQCKSSTTCTKKNIKI